MLLIVTLHGGYLYQIAHFCVINFTEGATWFSNFVVLNISWQKQQTTKYMTDELKIRLINE